MLDARATGIKESFATIVNSQPLKDKLASDPGFIIHAKTLLENGGEERFQHVEELSPFKPSSDEIKYHFMKLALFALVKDKETAEWSQDRKQKLDFEYIKLHAQARNTDDMLRLEPAWTLAVGLIFEAAFYLTKYNASPNAGPVVQFLPVINFLLLAGVDKIIYRVFKNTVMVYGLFDNRRILDQLLLKRLSYATRFYSTKQNV